MPHTIQTLGRSTAAMLTLLLATFSVQAAPTTSCYTAILKAVPPPIEAINLVLIDRTAPGAAAAVTGFRKIVATAAMRPNERFVLLPFAGLSAKEGPRPVLDVANERQLNPEQESSITLAKGRRMRNCISAVTAHNQAELDRVIVAAVQQPENPGGTYSEISFAIRTVVADFAQQGVPLRLFVFSDGAENSRGGQSFYGNGLPRLIDPARELAVLEKKGWASLPADKKPTALSAIWFGLGAVPSTSKHFLSPAELESLQIFWTKALEGYGAQKVQIGLVLNSPHID